MTGEKECKCWPCRMEHWWGGEDPGMWVLLFYWWQLNLSTISLTKQCATATQNIEERAHRANAQVEPETAKIKENNE